MNTKWRNFLIVALTCFSLLIGIILYSGNYLILGGEGNYFTDFKLTKDVGSYTWVSITGGTGYPNPTLNGLTVIFDFLGTLQELGISLKAINTLIVFLNYILPFLSMLWLLNKQLKQKFVDSYLISLFYILNPFSTFHLQGVMFWNTAPLFVLPLIFGLIYKYYFDTFKLFLFFGLSTSILAFSFSNIPYLGIFHIFLVISLIIIYFLRHDQSQRTGYRLMIRNFFITELSFVLFNAWWFVNLLRFRMEDLGRYTTDIAVGLAKTASGTGEIIVKIFTLKTLISFERGSYFSDFYHSIPMNMILFIPFLLIVWNLFAKTKTQKNKSDRVYSVVVAFILIIFFLNKGVNKPFENVYLWMLDSIPFFIIFKTPLEKFSVLLVFLVAISLIFVLKSKKKWPYYLLIIYLIATSIPYVTLNFMPDVEFENAKYISRRYLYKEGYFQAKKLLNTDKLDYRALSLPGSNNYQVTLLNHDSNKYYRGLDPLVYSVNKPFIAAYTSPYNDTDYVDHIFTNLSDRVIEDNLLNIYNVKKIVINEDIYPAFGFREKESVKKLKQLFSKRNARHEFHPISIFNREDFLPHFYLPKKNTISIGGEKSLMNILADNSHNVRPAIFFGKQNANRNLNLLKEAEVTNQTLEFKKINPVKYRIRVHGVKDTIPLIFSESFHKGWKAYLNSPTNSDLTLDRSLKIDTLRNYKIIRGNEDTQATKDELTEFINLGLVTDLGDNREKRIKHQKWENNKEKLDYIERFRIDFISKNFHSTIQNDNLPAGKFYETWFKTPIDEKNHFIANGYANSWAIDPVKLCGLNIPSQSSNCQRNADGTYDLELIVEFWPQQLFYLGLAISSLAAISGVGYLAINSLQRKRIKKQKI